MVNMKGSVNEAPFRFGKNFASSGIEPVTPWSEALGHADASVYRLNLLSSRDSAVPIYLHKIAERGLDAYYI